ncbi:hypothetical protein F4679DRAFT_505579 [Xylaria curta]|nr:hypothetical protein F4679DRAFT_505579 [Xylaria curta]
MAATAKSDAGEAPSKDNDRDEIVVILRPKTSASDSIPERRLVLTPSRPTVSIGRSSKHQSKGFIPAGDNAWLENPVMSREHAQLFVQFDDNPHAVYLKDVNSFHGTYLTTSDGCSKGQKVVPNEPVKLTHGDTIQFGIDIFRSNKTYPPCIVDYLVDGTTQKSDDLPHRSFTVPDDVDDEEDEDCENEDELTITAVHTRSDTIDLTRAWSPSVVPNRLAGAKLSTSSTAEGKTSSNAIDLTSEVATSQSDARPRIVNQGTPYPFESVIDSSVAPVSSFLNDHPNPQTGMRLNHAPDGRIVVIQSPLPVPSDDEELPYHDDLSDEELSSELDQYPESDLDAASEFTEEMSAVDEPFQTYDDDDTSSEISGIDESDDYPEDFDDSDSPCTDPYDDESIGDYSSDEEEQEEGEQDATTESSNAKPRTETPVLNAHETMQYETEIMQIFPPLPIWSPAHLNTYKPSHDRDPSPSDAALFQRRPPLLDPIPNESRAQELGEKSGKFEFFAAREKNRAAVNQDDSVAPIGAILETPVDDILPSSGIQSNGDSNPAATVTNTSRSGSPTLSCARDTVATDEETEDNSEAPDTSSIKLGENNTHQYSAWSASGDQFINNPPNEPSPACQPVLNRPPAELDMTSAYMFQQSKLATTAETGSKTRRLPIEDLLAQEPKSCPVASQPASEAPALGELPISHASTTIKRSYEEAFNRSEDDAMSECADRVIARCSPRIIEKDQDQTPSENIIDRAAIEKYIDVLMTRKAEAHNTPGHALPVTLDQPEPPRATKRMRLATAAAQVVACVALGSAATFSYLVNTAPVL